MEALQQASRQEQFLLRRLTRTRKLFGFLREQRHRLFDEGFQDEIEAMYGESGAGKQPIAPAQLAMAVLLQGYVGASDAEAVELTVVDLRWQMVLSCLGRRSLRSRRGLCMTSGIGSSGMTWVAAFWSARWSSPAAAAGFDWKKLPKTLRVAIDSAPLEGAGRVEDTFNLLGHAARNVVASVATLLDWTVDRVCVEAGIPVLLAPSVKSGLDVEWADPEQKVAAMKTLSLQLEALQTWIERRLPEQVRQPPLQQPLETLKQIAAQDLEPDPEGSGGRRVREGVAPERRISGQDGEMRHGRKSKTRSINGYKRHVAADLATGLILAATITPANRPEAEATPALQQDIEHQRLEIDELFIDRGYIKSPLVDHLVGAGKEVICKPWVPINLNGEHFTKAAFRLNLRDLTITCPANEVQSIRFGAKVEFDPERCDACPLRAKCTSRPLGHGRLVQIAEDERLQQRLRKQIATRRGRTRLRDRVAIEHHLVHVVQRQGRHARFLGVRINVFDIRRAAALQNLETIHRRAA